jgi:7-cyano-7-deazaguanine synthase
MSDRAVVLLSGGQDSTTCLFLAKTLYDEVHAVSVAYGQRHERELTAAEKIAGLAHVPWSLFHVDAIGEMGDSALVSPDAEIRSAGGRPDPHAPGGLPTSFVPGRNFFLVGVAAAYAAKIGARAVVTGVCETDFSGYPDCRRDTLDAFERALALGLGATPPVRIETPLMYKTKAETVRLARRLPGCWQALAESITCYNGHHPGCGTCPACVLRHKGFEEAGCIDPALDPKE